MEGKVIDSKSELKAYIINLVNSQEKPSEVGYFSILSFDAPEAYKVDGVLRVSEVNCFLIIVLYAFGMKKGEQIVGEEICRTPKLNVNKNVWERLNDDWEGKIFLVKGKQTTYSISALYL